MYGHWWWCTVTGIFCVTPLHVWPLVVVHCHWYFLCNNSTYMAIGGGALSPVFFVHLVFMCIHVMCHETGLSLCVSRCRPVRPSSVSSTSSSTTSEDSEDLQREQDEVVVKCCNGMEGNPNQATKLQFMNAVGEYSLMDFKVCHPCCVFKVCHPCCVFNHGVQNDMK
jgi:hypothetical protein